MGEFYFQDKLKAKSDKFVHDVYDASASFPKSELYGVTSQLRRASMSVVLNCVEGYARSTPKLKRNFLRISYGSLKESEYLIGFCIKRKMIDFETGKSLKEQSNELGAMLWGAISKIKT